MLRAAFGWDDEENSHRDAELLRNAIEPQAIAGYLRDAREWDATRSVRDVATPTLLLKISGSRYTTIEATRWLAAELPDGRLVMLDAATVAERMVQAFAAVADFVGADPSATLASHQPAYADTAIVLFTDIVGSTEFTERMGDAQFRSASRALDDGARRAIRASGGRPIDGEVLGDGVMGVFSSAAQAIESARACVRAAQESSLQLHIGLHAGDVIREDDNVYGGAVNIASRICGLCSPGEILVSATVRELARTSGGIAFEDRGEQMLKGIEDPVRVFAVRPESG